MARRSRGTPSCQPALKESGFCPGQIRGVITEEVARQALDLLDVDRLGLDHVDRNLLTTMIEKFQGGPVGLDTCGSDRGRCRNRRSVYEHIF